MAIDNFRTTIFMGPTGYVTLACRGRGHPEHTIVLARALRGQNRRCAQDIITNLGAAVIGNNMLKELERQRVAKVASGI